MNRKVLLLASCLFVPSILSAQVFSGWWTGGNLGFNYYAGLLLTLTPFHADSFCEDDDEVQQKHNLVSCVNARIGFDLIEDSLRNKA